jgi:hypothetical protein
MVGGGPSHDTTWAGKTCAADDTFDSSPKIFLNATYWNGSASLTAFQTSIQAVATSAASNGGYLGLGASATPDDLVILPTGNVGINVVDPSAYLDVVSNDASAYIAEFRQSNASNSGQIAIDSPTDSDSRPVFIDLQRAGTVKWSIGQGYNSSGGAFHFATSTLGAGVTNSQVEITTGGNIKIADGDLVISTAGHGIDFSAQTASTSGTVASELLDHYEEGSCTMNYTPASGAFGAMMYTSGKYTKIGNIVTVIGAISVNGAGTASGAVRITGWPFVPTGLNSTWSLESGHGVLRGQYGYPDEFNMVVMNNGGTNAYVYKDDGTELNVTNMSTGYNESQCSFTVTFMTDT